MLCLYTMLYRFCIDQGDNGPDILMKLVLVISAMLPFLEVSLASLFCVLATVLLSSE